MCRYLVCLIIIIIIMIINETPFFIKFKDLELLVAFIIVTSNREQKQYIIENKRNMITSESQKFFDDIHFLI